MKQTHFTVEQKTQLAKLMATENLTVEHQKLRTALFDPQNRILYLPIWKDMTGTLYDLLCGHEVGHALYTPAEGWHDAVVDSSKKQHYKSFLNVVEDARIEKKVKRKYPGLNKSFRDAYAELMKRDFFGLGKRDINKMAFIERLNLYTKSQYTLPIQFSNHEEMLVEKVKACETWEDTVRVTDEIYNYSKNEQYEMMLDDLASQEYSDEYGDDDYENDVDGGGDSDETEEDSESTSEEKTKKKSKPNSKSDEQEELDENEDSSHINRFKDSTPSTEDMFSPRCETDQNYRANESQLLDEKSKDYLYLTYPKPILQNIITPAKRVQELLTTHYKNEIIGGTLTNEKAQKLVSEFKNKNERYVGLLAKEFEMRKAAKAFNKSKLSDTGDIDISKLASFRFDDNIFRKVLLTPKGKNHGLILLLDKSGSMSNNMGGSIEQILVLAMFCRKVNIPFVVYGFGDDLHSKSHDLGLQQDALHKEPHLSLQPNKKIQCFEHKNKTLDLGLVFLREYVNNKMTNAEFNIAVRNMILLKNTFEQRFSNRPRPQGEYLSNTPLTQAIIACTEMMKVFKAANNLDLTSLVIVHDGDSDWTNSYWAETKNILEIKHDTNQKKTALVRKNIDSINNNVIIKDSKNNFEQKVPFILKNNSRDAMMRMALSYFKKLTGSKVFGFFLITGHSSSSVRGTIYHRHVLEDDKTYAEKCDEIRVDRNRWKEVVAMQEKVKDMAKQFRTDKFLVSNIPGFNSFFLVAGGDSLQTESDEIEIDGKITASKLKNAFMKMNKKKHVSRVLVSKFIQGIAA